MLVILQHLPPLSSHVRNPFFEALDSGMPVVSLALDFYDKAIKHISRFGFTKGVPRPLRFLIANGYDRNLIES
jgi:hypothetical protein